MRARCRAPRIRTFGGEGRAPKITAELSRNVTTSGGGVECTSSKFNKRDKPFVSGVLSAAKPGRSMRWEEENTSIVEFRWLEARDIDIESSCSLFNLYWGNFPAKKGGMVNNIQKQGDNFTKVINWLLYVSSLSSGVTSLPQVCRGVPLLFRKPRTF